MKHIMIIGNSAAGIAAAEAIRNQDKFSKLTIISDEDYTSYCRCVLSYYLSGEANEEKLIYRPKEFYTQNNINLILNKKVVEVRPKKNELILEDKNKFEYDTLFIATGSSAKIPQIAGVDKRGVFGLRTVRDAKDILGLLPVTKTAICLGGGLIGFKAAHALKKRGLEVKVIVKSKQILSQVLDNTCAEIIQRHLAANGLEILTGQDVTEFLGNGNLKAVKLDNGKVINCEVAVIGKGVSPNIGIVKDTQVELNQGIVVDRYLRSSVENIFAGGDCAEAYDYVYEANQVNALWPNAVEQGALAGENMLGGNLIYDGSLGINSVEFFNLPVISMGITKEAQGFEVLSRLDTNNKVYKKVILKGNRIKGVILLGRIENSGLYLELIKKKVDVSSILADLLSDAFNYAKIMDLLEKKEKIYV